MGTETTAAAATSTTTAAASATGAAAATTQAGTQAQTTTAATTDTTKAAETAAATTVLGDAKATEAAKPVVVDDKWEPKAVDGLKRDAAVVTSTRGLFKELGLNAEQAQKLVDYSDGIARTSAEAATKARQAQHSKWFDELRNDKELGGSNFDKSMANAQRGVRELGGAALVKRLVELGLDNDPVLVRAFEQAGRRLGEDTVANTTANGAASKVNGDPQQRALERAYPTMFGKPARKES